MTAENKTILLVEDEQITALMGKKTLEGHGFHVVLAATEEQAVETVDTHPDIDLILMDIDLGDGIDGTEAAEKILIKRDLPLVFLSSHTSPEIVNKTKSITNYGYVVKNTGEVVLIASIEMAFKLFDAKKALSIELDYRKKTEDRLKLQSEMLDIAPESITVHDFNGNALYLNKRTVELHGFEYDELIKMNLKNIDVMASHEVKLSRLRQVKEYGEAVFEVKHLRKDGSVFPLEVHAKKIMWQGIPAILSIAADITERKEAELKLEKSEKKYREIIENLNQGLWQIDSHGKTVYINSSMANMLGYSVEEISGRHLYEFMDEEWRKKAANNINRRKKGIKELHEDRFIHKNGETIYTLMATTPLYDDSGSYCGALAGVLDITDRKIMEEKLEEKNRELACIIEEFESANEELSCSESELLEREELLLESEKRYRTLFENSKDAIMLLSPSTGRFFDANESILNMFMYNSIDDFISLSPSKISPELQPDGTLSFEKSKEKINKALSEGSSYFEWNHLKSDGTVFPSTVLLTKMILHGETIIHAAVRDITDQKRAEEELQKLHNDFVTLLENTSDFIYFKDKERLIRFCSQAMAEITGYSDWKELIGKHDFQIFPEDTAKIYYDEEEPILKDGTPLLNKLNPYYDRNGNTGWVLTNKWPVFSRDKKEITGLFGISRDITERKKAEERIQMLLKESHHRVKNNMSTIYSLLRMQAARNEDSDSNSILINAAGQLKSMITMYDKLYRSSEYEKINMYDYITQLTKEITGLFDIHVPVETHVSVDDFDLNMEKVSPLSIIINELITNSMKHAFTGKQKGLITIKAFKNENIVTLTYSDNGTGLPEPFSIEENDTFGMQLVNMLVEQINGILIIENDNGAKFIIEFDI